MALTESQMSPLGTPLPAFCLRDVTTERVIDQDWLLGHVAVVAFICNHCPFVIHLKRALAQFGEHCQQQGIRMIAISSNDVHSHPQDGPDFMAEDAKTFGYPFPYLFDESQEVARRFGAVCTPDFFVFDAGGTLRYRGQFDESRPGNGKPVTGADLRAAALALAVGREPTSDQRPSIGCNIKWSSASRESR